MSTTPLSMRDTVAFSVGSCATLVTAPPLQRGNRRSESAKTKNVNPCKRCKKLKKGCNGDGVHKCLNCLDVKRGVACVYDISTGTTSDIRHPARSSSRHYLNPPSGTAAPTGYSNLMARGDASVEVTRRAPVQTPGVRGADRNTMQQQQQVDTQSHFAGYQMPFVDNVQYVPPRSAHSVPVPSEPIPAVRANLQPLMDQHYSNQNPSHYGPCDNQSIGQAFPATHINTNVFVLPDNSGVYSQVGVQEAVSHNNSHLPPESRADIRHDVNTSAPPSNSNDFPQENAIRPLLMVYDPGPLRPVQDSGTGIQQSDDNAVDHDGIFWDYWVIRGDFVDPRFAA